MSQSPTEFEKQQIVEAIYMYAAQLMKEGKSDWAVEDALVERGLPRDAAKQVVNRLSQARTQAHSNASFNRMARGGIIFLIGAAVTLATYSAAQGGGTYVVAWGAILFGGFDFLAGLMGVMGQN